MRIIVLTALLLSATAALAQSPLTTYLESVRQGSYAAVPQAVLADTANAATLLGTLATYQNDSVLVVRSRAYSIAKRIGQRSNDPAVRQTATTQLVRGIGDANGGISGNNSDGLTGFQRRDFSASAQTLLLDYLQPGTPHLDQVVMLAGFVQPEGVQPRLKQLLAAKVSATTRWAVRLALARTGEGEAADYILNKLDAAPINDALVYDVVPGLVYTRHPAVFDKLKEIVLSDEPSCQSADPDNVQLILCGYRVMEALAPSLEGFPVPTDQYGELLTDDYEQSLQVVRDWLRGLRDYPMKRAVY